MAGSTANTNTFIKSVLTVMETYGFDGIDIDWEVIYLEKIFALYHCSNSWQYPGASDRGGIPADKENYVAFMQAVKTAFMPRKYGLTL